MSTADFGLDDPAGPLPAVQTGVPVSDFPGNPAAMVGPEAIATLSRMANALFWARPGDRLEAVMPTDPSQGSPTHAHDIASPSASTTTPSTTQMTTSAIALPGEAELRDRLASRMALGSASPGGMPAAAKAPGMPVPTPAWVPHFMQNSSTNSAVAAPTDRLSSGLDRMAPPKTNLVSPDLQKTSPKAVPLPGEAELRAILAPGLATPSSAQPASSGAANSTVPYFLQDAAGHAVTAVPPNVATAAAPVPATETEAATFAPNSATPSTIPTSAEAVARSLIFPALTAMMPALPSVPTMPGAADAPSQALYFLDERSPGLRGVSSLDQVPAAGTVSSTGTHPPFDVNAIRRDFPILQEHVNGRPLIWLDNGATTQKPQFVIDRLVHYYQHENSNIHRAAHTLAARATDAYEEARETVRRFINASSAEEIVFVRGATEAINLVAQTWGRKNIGADDEILITWLEHHANIVPWQMLAQETGARLKVIPVDDSGQVLLDQYERLLGPRTRLVALTHVSNALGTVTPAARMIEMAKRYGARTLIDGAQAVSHMRTDVQVLDCDFYAFSGHKVFAPTGIGILYGKREVLDAMPPWQGGGNMIKDVTFEKIEYQASPLRFEAGTGNIADAVGLGAAINYVERIGMENIHTYEHGLLTYATHRLKTVPGLTLIGTAAEKAAVLSFVLDGFRSEDVGAALSQEGIAVRAGHHCAQPILRRFGLESTVRPSLAFYNNIADIDALTAAVQRIASRSPHLD